MADKRKTSRATRGTAAARGQIGRAARVAKGGLTLEMEKKVVEADRLVRKAQAKVDKAQAKLQGFGPLGKIRTEMMRAFGKPRGR